MRQKGQVQRGSGRSYVMYNDEYHKMYMKQYGVCAICEEEATHVDHSHKTGKIRGLLCNRCNLGLGLFRDDHVLLSLAAQYLRIHE